MEEQKATPKKKKKHIGLIILAVVLAILIFLGVKHRAAVFSTLRNLVSYDTTSAETSELPTEQILTEEELEQESAGKYNSAWENTVRSANVGDTILFGSYEQDNNTENGREDIEWIVMSKEGNCLTLLSKYILDTACYEPQNEAYSDDILTWKNSGLRKYMYTVMLNNAFSADAMKYLQSVNFTSEKFEDGSVTDTWDLIFCPEQEDIEKFYPTDEARIAAATDYTISKGLDCFDDENGVHLADWYLYSWHYNSLSAAIDFGGTVIEEYPGQAGIRPAVCINLDTDYIAHEEERIDSLGVDLYRKLKTAYESATLTLGSYEQDADETNGKEPIEWLILENDGSSMRLISQYILDNVEYNSAEGEQNIEGSPIQTDSWQNTSLCKWLNGEFYNAAFSAKEKSLLFKDDSGKTPTVTILTADEVRDYFPTSIYTGEMAKSALITAYARTKTDSYTEAPKSVYDDENTEKYSGCYFVNDASEDSTFGRVDYYGGISNMYGSIDCGVRPVIEIKW